MELDLSDLRRAQQTAQAFVEGALHELGINRDIAHNAGWAGSELVGNAIRHATRPYRLRLHGADNIVTVCVADGLPVPVDVQRYATPLPELTLDDIDALPLGSPEIEHRRGLSTVAEISQGRLGCSIRPGEKNMWFMLSTPARAALRAEQIERLLVALGSPPAIFHCPSPQKTPPSVGSITETAR